MMNEWTNATPTGEGWYWFEDDMTMPEVVHVIVGIDVDTGEKNLIVCFNGEESIKLLKNIGTDARWAGPIPRPTR